MFDVWLGGVELTTAVLILSGIVLFSVQLLICFRVKRTAIRLLPVLLFSVPTLFFIAMAAVKSGWDSLGYIVLAVFAGVMTLSCGAAWAVWALIRLMQKKKAH